MTSTALQIVEPGSAPAPAVVHTIPGTALTYGDTARLAKTLHASGLLGGKVKSAEQAFAIIVAGAELGLPPMLALRSVSLIDGKPIVAADVQLGAFKRAGGRATFRELSETRAVLWLRHPNGDEHVESFGLEEAKAAGLATKDNWRKFPKAMLRSRVITAALKSVGFEPTAGMYDPDEAQHFARGDASGDERGDERGEATPASGVGNLKEMTLADANAMTVADNPTAFRGKGADLLGTYSTEHLLELRTWFEEKQREGHRDDFALRIEAITLLLEDREKDQGKLALDVTASADAVADATARRTRHAPVARGNAMDPEDVKPAPAPRGDDELPF